MPLVFLRGSLPVNLPGDEKKVDSGCPEPDDHADCDIADMMCIIKDPTSRHISRPKHGPPPQRVQAESPKAALHLRQSPHQAELKVSGTAHGQRGMSGREGPAGIVQQLLVGGRARGVGQDGGEVEPGLGRGGVHAGCGEGRAQAADVALAHLDDEHGDHGRRWEAERQRGRGGETRDAREVVDERRQQRVVHDEDQGGRDGVARVDVPESGLRREERARGLIRAQGDGD